MTITGGSGQRGDTAEEQLYKYYGNGFAGNLVMKYKGDNTYAFHEFTGELKGYDRSWGRRLLGRTPSNRLWSWHISGRLCDIPPMPALKCYTRLSQRRNRRLLRANSLKCLAPLPVTISDNPAIGDMSMKQNRSFTAQSGMVISVKGFRKAILIQNRQLKPTNLNVRQNFVRLYVSTATKTYGGESKKRSH